MKHIEKIREGFKSFQNATPFIVGGFVRDKFLDLTSDDLDIAVKGVSFNKLKEIVSTFADNITEPVGNQFSVLIADINGHKIDFTVETGVSIVEDLKRRDFTINAMAINIKTGAVINPFNGFEHLKEGVLHPTSSAFSEDPLRIFRAARFISRFNLKPTDELIEACRELDISNLTSERVGLEIWKAAKQANDFSTFFEFLKKCGKEGEPVEHEASHPFVRVAIAARTNPWILNFIESQITKKGILFIERLLSQKEMVELLLDLKSLKFVDDSIMVDFVNEFFNFEFSDEIGLLIERGLFKPLVTGKTLIKRGLTPGPHFGSLLKKLHKMQLEGNLHEETLDIVIEELINNN